MNCTRRILTINLGSTSSKASVFQGDAEICNVETEHPIEDLKRYPDVSTQYAMRKEIIQKLLEQNGISLASIQAIAARGCGGPGRYHAGAYIVDDRMAQDCRKMGHMGLALAPMIANDWAKAYHIPAYIYDVVPTDEIEEVARISGMPLISRKGASHTLNTKAVARQVAQEIGSAYENVTFIMCHMGGGIGANLHRNGRIIDVVSTDEGTFTPDRSGRVPCMELAALCMSGKYSAKEIKCLLSGQAGLIGYLQTNDCKEVERRIAGGDQQAELIYRAMAYQIAKDIGSLAAVACGKVDRIVLTGGIAHSRLLTGWIKDYVGFIAPVVIVPGSMEMEALMRGVSRVLDGEETALPYIPGDTVL